MSHNSCQSLVIQICVVIIRYIKSLRGRMAAGDLCGGNRKPLHKDKTLTSDSEVENLQDLPESDLSGADSRDAEMDNTEMR